MYCQLRRLGGHFADPGLDVVAAAFQLTCSFQFILLLQQRSLLLLEPQLQTGGLAVTALGQQCGFDFIQRRPHLLFLHRQLPGRRSRRFRQRTGHLIHPHRNRFQFLI